MATHPGGIAPDSGLVGFDSATGLVGLCSTFEEGTPVAVPSNLV